MASEPLNKETEDFKRYLAEKVAKMSPKEIAERADDLDVAATLGETRVRLSKELGLMWIDSDTAVSLEDLEEAIAALQAGEGKKGE